MLVHCQSYGIPIQPSRALFAVAMTASSTSWSRYNIGDSDNKKYQPSATTKSIVSSTRWGKLDFVKLEKSVSEKLSDDDLFAILQCIDAHRALQCIDAHRALKRLKLTGCTNITDWGLSPLMRSTVLELIDLNVISNNEIRDVSIEPTMTREMVLPIMDSIVANQDCALK